MFDYLKTVSSTGCSCRPAQGLASAGNAVSSTAREHAREAALIASAWLATRPHDREQDAEPGNLRVSRERRSGGADPVAVMHHILWGRSLPVRRRTRDT